MRSEHRRWIVVAAAEGFTLIEVVVALLVVAVALVLAAPALPRPRSPLDTAARTLAARLEEARRSAAGSGSSVTLSVQPSRDGVVTQTWSGVETRRFQAVRLPAGVDLQIRDDGGEPLDEVRFEPQGLAQGATITLVDASGAGQRWIVLEPGTGRSRVQRR